MVNLPTIAAIASAPGRGAIALARVSGEEAFPICDKIFLPADKGGPLSSRAANTIHYGRITDNGEIIDEVLVSIFKAPRSYTGEDIVEISCHGSVFIQQRIIRLLLDNGAEPARPGEFTQRAFLNGKMDLSQAEAVADLIASESSSFHKIAMQQMRGGFSNEIKILRNKLLEFISLIELELDFSEEDVEFAERDELKSLLERISNIIYGLTSSFSLGNAIKNGIPVVIAGKPNVGKSTLLNRLLMEEKALVSEIPGTTRDTIEDVIHIEGISFRFIDTAGLRETTDTVELMGIKRTLEKVRIARIVLLMAEATDSEEHIDYLTSALRKKDEFKEKTIILVINKSDLLEDRLSREKSSRHYSSTGSHFSASSFPSLKNGDHVISISAKKDIGLEKLKELLISAVHASVPAENDIVITNMRHYKALKNADEAIRRASDGMDNNLTGDLLSMDIREVLHYLGEITGEITTDEILGNIFKNFCIGK